MNYTPNGGFGGPGGFGIHPRGAGNTGPFGGGGFPNAGGPGLFGNGGTIQLGGTMTGGPGPFGGNNPPPTGPFSGTAGTVGRFGGNNNLNTFGTHFGPPNPGVFAGPTHNQAGGLPAPQATGSIFNRNTLDTGKCSAYREL